MELYQEVRLLRCELGWTQEQLAKAIEDKYGYRCSLPTICAMEKGRGRNKRNKLINDSLSVLRDNIEEHDETVRWIKERHERNQNALQS